MYDECITCDMLGRLCDGPNFISMPAADLLDWCKRRKQHLGLSRERLADLSGVPLGTINRLLSGTHYDFRYETLRPIIMVLIGGTLSGNPCPSPDLSGENEQLRAELANLRSRAADLPEPRRSLRRHSRRRY